MSYDNVSNFSNVAGLHHELVARASDEVVPSLGKTRRAGVSLCAVDHQLDVGVGSRAA
jgi:hypothetical protein